MLYSMLTKILFSTTNGFSDLRLPTYTPTPASPPFDRSSSPTMFPSGSLSVTSRPTGTSYGASLNV